MKLQAFLMMLAVVFAASCTSASDENVSATAPVEDTTPAVVAKLQALNDSLMATRAVISRGRPTQDHVLSFLGIAAADIRGAYELGKLGGRIGALLGPKGMVIGMGIGGLVGGVGSSYVAYRACRSTNVVPIQDVVSAYCSSIEDSCDIRDYYPHNIHYAPGDTSAVIREMGPKHNLVLDRLIHQQFTARPIDWYLDSTQVAIVTSAQFIEKYNETLSKYDSNGPIPGFFDESTVSGRIMKQFVSIFIDYPQQAEDVEFITNKYSEILSNSKDLTSYEKQVIFSALSVAASSYEYWQQHPAKSI